MASDVHGEVIPGAGHWLMEEARGPVIERIVAFVDAVQPTPPRNQ